MPLTKDELVALKMLSKRNVRYGTRYKTMRRLADIGLAASHSTGRPPPGAWTWTITPAGRAALNP